MKIDKVFVLGLFYPSLDIADSLKLSKIGCKGFDYRKKANGFYSSRIESVLCPNPKKDSNALIECLFKHAAKDKKIVLYITSDDFVEFVYDNKSKLSENFIFFESENNQIKEILSKRGLNNVFQKTSLELIKTVFYSDVKNGKVNIDINFPCILKPEFAGDWREPKVAKELNYSKVIYCSDEEDLAKSIKKISQLANDKFIIQEVIPGPDDNLLYFVSLLDNNSDPLGFFCGKKKRISPIHFGSATYVETYYNEELFKQCLQALKEIGYKGISGIELKIDSRDGKMKLIEINPRFGLWDILGSKIGVDLPLLYYDYLVKNEVKRVLPINENRYWLSITRDLRVLKEYKQEGLLSVKEIVMSYCKRKTFFPDIKLNDLRLMSYLYFSPIRRKIFGKFFNRN